ncbi:hypothetical protein FCV25MIE_32974 [Fagus crenata]
MPLPAAVVSPEFIGVPSTSVVLGQPADTSVEPVQDNSSSLTSFLPPSEPHDHASALFCPRVALRTSLLSHLHYLIKTGVILAIPLWALPHQARVWFNQSLCGFV